MDDSKKLVRKAQYGDKDAFVELMRMYKNTMSKAALAILGNEDDAADAIQDAYLACFRNIHKLKKVNYFKTWLIRILINKCYDIRKKNSRYVGFSELSEPMYHERAIDELEDDILAELGENYSLILSLYYVSGFSAKEIAAMLKMNENTVRTRLSRGRDKLNERFKSRLENA